MKTKKPWKKPEGYNCPFFTTTVVAEILGLNFLTLSNKKEKFATEVISKLKQENEIYIITARNEEGLPKELYGTMKEMVKNWLQCNTIKYDELIFSKFSLSFSNVTLFDSCILYFSCNIAVISDKLPNFFFFA